MGASYDGFVEMSIPALMDRVPDDEAAYRFLEELRWGDEPLCPHCGSIAQHYFLTPRAEDGRKTRTGKVTVRRLWKCRDCRKQFSVLTGTIFHGTKISIRTWVLVIFEMCASKNGVAGREIERKYGLTPRSAWFMLQRIREAMNDGDPTDLFTGVVTADETWVGGKPRNRHKHVRYAEDRKGGTDKTPVMTIHHRDTGAVRSRVIPDVTRESLKAVLDSTVDMPRAVLHTDNAQVYIRIGWKAAEHHSVNHVLGEYVRGDVTTNHAEGYFSQLKRSLDGTHHHVSVNHLQRYVSEFDFRYTHRKDTDTARVHRLMGNTGRRLTYDDLTNR